MKINSITVKFPLLYQTNLKRKETLQDGIHYIVREDVIMYKIN